MPAVHNILRSQVSSFLTNQNLPIGVLADKMTANHRTRHKIGVRVPIWDMRYSCIVKNIHIQSSAVKLHTGIAVPDHLFDSLNAAGFSNVYF